MTVAVASDWNRVAAIFDTKSKETVDPRAADNILIAWPSILNMLQDPELTNKRPLRLILDFGCGTGGFVDQLGKWGYDATGIDTAEGMISIAKKSFPHRRFDSCSVWNIPYNYTYDAITAIMVFQFLDDKELKGILSQLLRHLEVGGRFVFAVHDSDYLAYAQTKTKKYFVDQSNQMYISFKEHGDVKIYPRSADDYIAILESLNMKKHAEATPPFTPEYVEKYGAHPSEPLDKSKFLIMSFVKQKGPEANYVLW